MLFELHVTVRIWLLPVGMMAVHVHPEGGPRRDRIFRALGTPESKVSFEVLFAKVTFGREPRRGHDVTDLTN